MENLISIMNNNAWVGVLLASLLAIHTVLKAANDALQSIRAEVDKTPATDDNGFERFVTKFNHFMAFMGKIAGYLIGFRSKKV